MRIRSTTSVSLAAALALAAACLTGAQAQTPAPRIVNTSKDPKDISGVWFITQEIRMNADLQIRTRENSKNPSIGQVMWPQNPHREPPFSAWGRARWDKHYKAMVNSAPIADPATSCIPHGVPRIIIAPYPVQIIQSPGLITMLYEVNHNVRLVHMNRPLPKNPKITMMGSSVGHWDGDTLVIETVGLDDSAILDEAGTPHSTKLKVTERLRKIDQGSLLEASLTFDDPVAYTAPWTSREVMAWRPDIQLTEYVCEENNRNPVSADGSTSVPTK